MLLEHGHRGRSITHPAGLPSQIDGEQPARHRKARPVSQY